MKTINEPNLIRVRADKGKALKMNDNVFHGGVFPIDFDTSIIEEVEEPVCQEDVNE